MSNKENANVKIVEVGPRDGLQNETMILPTEFKVQFILDLIDAGATSLEVTSFVRADKIPQMGDCVKLVDLLQKKLAKTANMELFGLVPNLKGLEMAKQAGITDIAIFTATSDTFNQKNINATVDESMLRILPVIAQAKKLGMKVRGYVSTVFGCPYEGQTSVDKLKKVSQQLMDAGVDELSLGDTIGVGNPLQVKEIIAQIKTVVDLKKIAMHFHDTQGLALANILRSYEEGIRIFDSSAGGLGGCPYAKGATGNVATEDVVHLFHSMQIQTGIDLAKLNTASEKVLQKIGKNSVSKYHQYLLKKA